MSRGSVASDIGCPAPDGTSSGSQHHTKCKACGRRVDLCGGMPPHRKKPQQRPVKVTKMTNGDRFIIWPFEAGHGPETRPAARPVSRPGDNTRYGVRFIDVMF